MVNHFARPRRNRGAWLDTLLSNHAEQAGADLEDLRDFVETVKDVKHALLAVDNPAPARGYAVVLPKFTPQNEKYVVNAAVARIHVIPNQSDDVYRALFSQIIVQVRNMRLGMGLPFEVSILVDSSTATNYVVDAVERLGAPYAVKMGKSVGEELTLDRGTPLTAPDLDVNIEVELGEGATTEDAAELAVELEKALIDDGVPDEVAAEIVEDTVKAVDDALSPEPDYVAMNKSELAAAAKELGISSKGTATELRQRLIAHADEAE